MMELPSTVMATHSNAQPSKNILAALQPALADRSFDLGEDDVPDNVDLNSAFGPSAPIPSTSAIPDNGSGIDAHDTGDDSDLLEEADDQDLLPPEGLDVFPGDEADAMIDELKEIGMFKFIEKYVVDRQIELEKLLYVFGIVVPSDLEEDDRPSPIYLLRILKIAISRALRNRFPLDDICTPEHVLDLLRTSEGIVILTGAGISTNCGIPDFRSPQGIYARLVQSGRWPELSDPQEMFDMRIFLENPEIFYSFAKELYPTEEGHQPTNTADGSLAGGKKAGKVHHWIRNLEKQGKLLRNYTQNIDTLEMIAGIHNVLHAHGSFATCSCVKCKAQFPGDTIKDAIFAETVPLCPLCTAASAALSQEAQPASKKRKLGNGYSGSNDEASDNEDYVPPWKDAPLLKPDITFFGQALDDAFDRCLLADREEVDLLIVVGTSLQVAPVAELLGHIPHRVPQILINRDPVPHVMQHVDVSLLGDCDRIIEWIQRKMSVDSAGTEDVKASEPRLAFPDGMDNVWLFEGANEEHRWMQRMREVLAEQEEVDEPVEPANLPALPTPHTAAGVPDKKAVESLPSKPLATDVLGEGFSAGQPLQASTIVERSSENAAGTES